MLVRTLYKAFGASLAWQMEIRWEEAGGHGHVAQHMLNTRPGGATTITSYKKQFRRWKDWSSDESSFASADEETLEDVLKWCQKEGIFSRKSCDELKSAMTALLRYLSHQSSPADLYESLEKGLVSITSLAQVARVEGKKAVFLDARENRRFRRNELGKFVVRGVRLDKQAKRWRVVEATIVGIETVEKITRIFDSARTGSETWSVPKRDLTQFKSKSQLIAGQLSAILVQTALTHDERIAKGEEAINMLSQHMLAHFKSLQNAIK